MINVSKLCILLVIKKVSLDHLYYYYGVASAGSTQRHYIVGRDKRRRKTEKLVGFSSASLQGNGRQSARLETMIINHQSWRITKGAGIVKGWEEKRDQRHIPDTLT